MADEYLGWRCVLYGNLDVCEVPGRQQDLLSAPNVSRLAQEFGGWLKAAQQPCYDYEGARERTASGDARGAMFPIEMWGTTLEMVAAVEK